MPAFCHGFFFVSCQVPHRGHAHRGRHRLQATVLNQGSRLMVYVGFVRFVTFLSGTALRAASANDGRLLASGTESQVCSLVLGLLLPGDSVLNLNEVNIFVVFQPLHFERNKAQGIAVLIRFCAHNYRTFVSFFLCQVQC